MNDSHGWTAIRLVAWAFCRALVSIVLGHRYFVIEEEAESGERVHRIAYCLPESMERDDIDGTILPIVTSLLSSASKEHELNRFQTILGEWENRYEFVEHLLCTSDSIRTLSLCFVSFCLFFCFFSVSFLFHCLSVLQSYSFWIRDLRVSISPLESIVDGSRYEWCVVRMSFS